MPRRCIHMRLPGGGTAILTVQGTRCQRCHRGWADYACDYPDDTRRSKTCDRKLCKACARQVGADLHVCPEHPRDWTPPRQTELLL